MTLDTVEKQTKSDFPIFLLPCERLTLVAHVLQTDEKEGLRFFPPSISVILPCLFFDEISIFFP